ncbi:MAG: type I-B CRISPR-associated protein Cas7/Csh2 [Candidatus Kapaibacteriota bacterium]
MSAIQNRSEILFLYDVKDANPNGDPVDENKPRIDEETGINIVTDVRLKRTIRDYLHDKGFEIFVRKEYTDGGKLKTKEDLFDNYQSQEEVVRNCIDIRLFGGTFALKKDKKAKSKTDSESSQDTESKTEGEGAFSITGPVQFKFGRSLHKVDLTYYKGTTIMPSKAGVEQGTFWEKYILPYSLICFYGVVNENATKQANINIELTDKDVDSMLEAMWNGTRNLISGSKFGQVPRFLLQVVYKSNEDFHVGELDKFVHLVTNIEEEAIRDVDDFKIEIRPLIDILKKNQNKIEKVRFKFDPRIKFTSDGYDIDIYNAFSFLNYEYFNF